MGLTDGETKLNGDSLAQFYATGGPTSWRKRCSPWPKGTAQSDLWSQLTGGHGGGAEI